MICRIVTLLYCLTVSTVSVGLTASISLSRHSQYVPHCLTASLPLLYLSASLPHYPYCICLPHCLTLTGAIIQCLLSSSARTQCPEVTSPVDSACSHSTSLQSNTTSCASRCPISPQNPLPERSQSTESSSRALSVHRLQYHSTSQCSLPEHSQSLKSVDSRWCRKSSCTKFGHSVASTDTPCWPMPRMTLMLAPTLADAGTHAG